MQLAHFSTACDQQSPELAEYLTDLLDALSDGEDVGVEPYQVPRRLIDLRSVHTMDLTSFLTSFVLGQGTYCSTLSFRTTLLIFTRSSTRIRETGSRVKRCGQLGLSGW
jgi:hypothetical protein